MGDLASEIKMMASTISRKKSMHIESKASVRDLADERFTVAPSFVVRKQLSVGSM